MERGVESPDHAGAARGGEVHHALAGGGRLRFAAILVRRQRLGHAGCRLLRPGKHQGLGVRFIPARKRERGFPARAGVGRGQWAPVTGRCRDGGRESRPLPGGVGAHRHQDQHDHGHGGQTDGHRHQAPPATLVWPGQRGERLPAPALKFVSGGFAAVSSGVTMLQPFLPGPALLPVIAWFHESFS